MMLNVAVKFRRLFDIQPLTESKLAYCHFGTVKNIQSGMWKRRNRNEIHAISNYNCWCVPNLTTFSLGPGLRITYFGWFNALHIGSGRQHLFNTLRPEHNGHRLVNDILKCIFLKENFCIRCSIFTEDWFNWSKAKWQYGSIVSRHVLTKTSDTIPMG